MPRIARVAFEEAFYHIFSRGVNRQKIFVDTFDFQKFLKRLENLKGKFDHSIYCYCLLPNHFHLSLQTRKTPISKIMSSLLISYSMYFNRKHDRVGPLFQDRFRSVLIEKDSYFLELSRYIHLQPVRTGLVEDPIDYPWSSYQELFGQSEFSIIDKEDVTRLIGENKKELESYKEFVLAGIEMEDFFDPFEAKVDVIGGAFFTTSSQRKYVRRKNL